MFPRDEAKVNITFNSQVKMFHREGSPYLAYKDRNAFSLWKRLKNSMHGLVKMYVRHLPFYWTTFLFDLALSCIESWNSYGH